MQRLEIAKMLSETSFVQASQFARTQSFVLAKRYPKCLDAARGPDHTSMVVSRPGTPRNSELADVKASCLQEDFVLVCVLFALARTSVFVSWPLCTKRCLHFHRKVSSSSKCPARVPQVSSSSESVFGRLAEPTPMGGGMWHVSHMMECPQRECLRTLGVLSTAFTSPRAKGYACTLDFDSLALHRFAAMEHDVKQGLPALERDGFICSMWVG